MHYNIFMNKNSKHKTILKAVFALLLFSAGTIKANEQVSFQATGPERVVMDRPFQVTFVVTASTQGTDFRVPEITDFEILAGPFTSHSTSTSIINGQHSSSVTARYTYTLMPRRVGTFTIPSASITVRGQRHTSTGLRIEVLPADAQVPAQQQGAQQQNQPRNEISDENLFIRTIVSKTTVYEQEVVLLTYRLYSTLNIVNAGARNMPNFRGFMRNDLDITRQLTLENFRGRNYTTVDLFSTVLYPQRAGTIEIEPAEFDVVIRVENTAPRRSIFDSFFDTHTNVSRTVTAPRARITVNELPTANRPANFGGTVGSFRMNSSISSQEVNVNEAITMNITIEGTGNMRMIATPSVRIPESFERFDPRVVNDFRPTTSGVSGRKTVEYLFIPRHSGDFEIPSVEFSFFDLQTQTYTTLRTPTYAINVLRGDGTTAPTTVAETFLGREEVRQLARDIRHIRTNDFAIAPKQTPKVGSPTSWLMFLIPLVLTLLAFIFLSKQAKESANIGLVKNKKANKMARKRLKLAQKLLSEGKKDQFYDEVLKAVWNYLSDKMSIPLSSLTKDNVEAKLKSRQVDETHIKQLMNILNTCEFARYAPNSGQQEMGNLFDETVQVISNLEEKIK